MKPSHTASLKSHIFSTSSEHPSQHSSAFSPICSAVCLALSPTSSAVRLVFSVTSSADFTISSLVPSILSLIFSTVFCSLAFTLGAALDIFSENDGSSVLIAIAQRFIEKPDLGVLTSDVSDTMQ